MVRQLTSSISPLIRSRNLTSRWLNLNSITTTTTSSSSRPLSSISNRSTFINNSNNSTITSSNLLLFNRGISTSTNLSFPFKVTSILLEGRKPIKKGGKLADEKLASEESTEESNKSSNVTEVGADGKEIEGSTTLTTKKDTITTRSSSSSSSAATPPSDSSTPPSSSGDNSSDSSNSTPPTSTGSTSIARTSVPDIYPQVLALPITRRPLFPGFYKAVVIRNPAVVAAIKEAVKRGQPYIGAFLLKDENSDSDV